MRFLVYPLLLLLVSGCSLVYRLPTRQGNVIEQKQVAKLQLGQTREQVKFLMGTPITTSPFVAERWDYLGYYRTPRGKTSTRLVTLYFTGDKLAKMEGTQLASAKSAIESPDTETLQKNEKQDKNDQTRRQSEEGKETGVTIPTP